MEVTDSTGKPVKVGDRVRFRGMYYTVKSFSVSSNFGHDFYFEQKQHTLEVANSTSIDLVESEPVKSVTEFFAEVNDLENVKLRKAIERLYIWQYKDRSSFSSLLYTLFAKGDLDNRRKIAKAFPEEALAYSLWSNHSNPDEFFRKQGFEVL